jgi:NADH-quinone oxidoreductase subunit N
MSGAITLREVWLVAPAIILFLTSLVPITMKVLNGNREQPSFVTVIEGIVGVGIAAMTASYQWTNVKEVAFSGALIFDGISSVAVLGTLFILTITLLLLRGHVSLKGDQLSEQVFLVINAAVGMLILIWSNDLISVFVGMELMSLALYVLVGLSHEQKLSKEAAFKYFILGSLGAALFLYGTALIFGTAEGLSFTRISEVGPSLMATNKIFTFGGAPTPITAFMATAVKLSIFTVLIRAAATQGFFTLAPSVNALQWVAVLTMLVGNLSALKQTNFKRLLAYSSIAHSGYALVGIAALGVSKTSASGASSVLFYLLSYALMNLGAFALIGLYERSENVAVYVNDLRGLGFRQPGKALALSICLLSLAGIPPTAGFFGKFFLFSSAVNEGLYWIVIWGVLNSVISVYYYLRPVILMYMTEREVDTVDPSSEWLGQFALVVSAILIVAAGLMSQPFYSAIITSVEGLLH